MKNDIRHNRNNAAEWLGFIGHVVHGDNSRTWLKEIRQRRGEGIDFDSTVTDRTNMPGLAVSQSAIGK